MKPINILGIILILLVFIGFFITTAVEKGFRIAAWEWSIALVIAMVIIIGVFLMCA
ncbi:MAG: hypothetical protein ACRC3H_07245 [Lachnospiraceae bacterium]